MGRIDADFDRTVEHLGLIGIDAVSQMVGLGRTQIFRLRRAADFPAPVKYGIRAYWRRDEVAAWLEKRLAA